MRFFNKLKMELPYGPEVPFAGIYLKKKTPLIRKDTYTSMFVVALFITANIWKQPK